MKRVLVVLLMVAGLSSPVLAQKDARVERLAGLAKVWNMAKYFHPALAERDIDWDKALIEAIPRVNAAKNGADYSKAIDAMLGELGDKATFVAVGEAKAAKHADITVTGETFRVVNGILIVDAYAAASRIAADQSNVAAFNKTLGEMLPTAKGVVVDCRAPLKVDLYGDEAIDYEFNEYLMNLVPRLIDRDIRLGSSRYRMYNGYMPQIGITSGGYYAGTVTDTPAVMAAAVKKAVPMSFIINANSPDESSLWGALQSAGYAAVIQEGELTDALGASAIKIALPDGLSARIRVTELVNPDGSTGFQSDAKVDAGGDALAKAIKMVGDPVKRSNASLAAKPQRDSHERFYDEMQFPSKEYRLLALFRFWGVIEHFYTNKDLIADTWPTVLERYIPKFETNASAFDYQATVRELSTELHDSHGSVGGTPDFDAKAGLYLPPVIVRYVEGRPVVIKVLDEKIALKRGDVIESVDGRPEKQLRDELARYQAVSTPQALMWGASTRLLRGPKDSVAKITVRTGREPARTVELVRSLARTDPKYYRAYDRTGDIVRILPSGYGYVDLGRLQIGEVDDMFKKIATTKAVIFDMRGYPNATAWEIAPRLTDRVKPVGAVFSRPITTGRDLNDSDFAVAHFSFQQTLPERHGDVYRGKVVMLIDESAISQAEHTCLFFEAATDVAFIGMPTNGANGDVTNVVLPGGVRMSFSGQTVRHADGRPLQRVGIQPKIKVEPTVAGVAAGRDEILDAAVKFLRSSVK
jgi:C-terminal processing protease CtpA/Prc